MRNIDFTSLFHLPLPYVLAAPTQFTDLVEAGENVLFHVGYEAFLNGIYRFNPIVEQYKKDPFDFIVREMMEDLGDADKGELYAWRMKKGINNVLDRSSVWIL